MKRKSVRSNVLQEEKYDEKESINYDDGSRSSAFLTACGSSADSAGAGDLQESQGEARSESGENADNEAAGAEDGADEAEGESDAQTENAPSGGSYTIGICQLVQHEALDAATEGFKDALNELCGEGNVTFDERNDQ